MVMKRGFTLIEMIVTIVILGILSAGTFISLEHLYIRSAKSKAISDLSFESQMIVDQIAVLMYERIPASVIGYNPSTNAFASIYAIDNNFTVLEWIGVAHEALKLRAYSGFVDMNASIKPKLSSIGINNQAIDSVVGKKFSDGNVSKMGLFFAGSFDDGALYDSNEFNTTFGWHGNGVGTKIYDFTIANDGNITLLSTPNEIYEKYYMVDSGYAIARGSEVNLFTCNYDFNVTTTSNTLFLFYNFRPWIGETFCGDKGSSGVRAGNVTILSQHVSGFEAGVINGTIYFNLSMNKVIRGSENNVTISKQKAVY